MDILLVLLIFFTFFVVLYKKNKDKEINNKNKNKVGSLDAKTQETLTTLDIVESSDISDILRKSFLKFKSTGLPFESYIVKEKALLEKLNFLREIEVTQKNGKKKKKLVYEDTLKDIFNVNNKLIYANEHYDNCMDSLMIFFRYYAENCSISSHRKLNNLILPKEHLFWDTHFPPNALKCECSISCYGKEDLKRLGLEVTSNLPYIEIENLYNKNYAKHKIKGELITPYIHELDVSKKVKKILTNEYINTANEYVNKADNLKTTSSKNKYLDMALVKLNDGLNDNSTDKELLTIEINKINHFKQDLNTI